MPLISVHLPARDAAGTLPLAVRSTLAALPRDAELVVLDDASREHLGGALAGFEDRRLRLQRIDVSAGIGPARQLLLDRTDSEYVASMDADDVTLTGRFRSQLRALRGGADLVFSPIISFWDTPRRIRPGLPLPISAEAMPLHLLVHNLLCNPTMAARRSAVDAAGGYRSVVAEDHDLWLRALAAGLRLQRTARPVLAYRHHPRQTSKQQHFIGSAFDDPPLRAAYDEFVDRNFGVPASWLEALWSRESGTERMVRELAPLRALIESRRTVLGPVQQAVLARTVRLLAVRE
ncbi:glycosyltransferase [Georgenia sp. M64]|uniref:glycosyltransferase family 2 protein n=1 Tax=Georgenia sp. M64 TaxID=3120520 RepID=UPI0030E0117F